MRGILGLMFTVKWFNKHSDNLELCLGYRIMPCKGVSRYNSLNVYYVLGLSCKAQPCFYNYISILQGEIML